MKYSLYNYYLNTGTQVAMLISGTEGNCFDDKFTVRKVGKIPTHLVY